MIVAGFGFTSKATLDSLTEALSLAGRTPDRLATAADKAESPAFQALARHLALPVAALSQQAIANHPTVTQSAASTAARGTGSLAEAAALAAAGPGARLLGARVISSDRRATCALAIGGQT